MNLIWLLAGIFFIVSEIIIPGGIVIFLGIASLIVAGSITLGLISGWVDAFVLWFISSLSLLIFLRSFFQRFMPGDVEVQNTDEDIDALGSIAEVIEKIEPGRAGRINFRGTSWTAVCYNKTLLPGSKAKLLVRENLDWVVEPDDFNEDNYN